MSESARVSPQWLAVALCDRPPGQLADHPRFEIHSGVVLSVMFHSAWGRVVVESSRLDDECEPSCVRLLSSCSLADMPKFMAWASPIAGRAEEVITNRRNNANHND